MRDAVNEDTRSRWWLDPVGCGVSVGLLVTTVGVVFGLFQSPLQKWTDWLCFPGEVAGKLVPQYFGSMAFVIALVVDVSAWALLFICLSRIVRWARRGRAE